MPSLDSPDHLGETSVVNDVAFRRSYGAIFAQFPNVTSSDIYNALKSTNPPWDQKAAITDLETKKNIASNTHDGSSDARSNDKDASSKRREKRLRGKRKAGEYAELMDNQIDTRQRRVAFRPSTKTNVKRYVTDADELVEDDRLAIIDEDCDDEDEDELSGFRDDSLPCRTLTNWTLFDEEHEQKLAGLEEIGQDGCDIRAVGIVRPKLLDTNGSNDSPDLDDDYDEDDDEAVDDGNDDDEDPVVSRRPRRKRLNECHQILRLSAIFLWEVVMRGDGGFEIWLRTQYAFYHLLEPSDEIVPFVKHILRRLSLSAIVISTMEIDPNIDPEDFLAQLQSNTLPVQTGIGVQSSSQVKRNDQGPSTGSSWLAKFTFPPSYIKSEAQYLFGEISAYIDSGLDSGDTLTMLEAPLLAYIAKLAKNKQISFGTATRAPTRRAGSPRGKGNINDKVLLHEIPTTVTKWIGRLAGGLFVRTLMVTDGGEAVRSSPGIKAAAGVDEELRGKDGHATLEALIDITCDPKIARKQAWEGRRETMNIKWLGKEIWRSRSDNRIGYAAANIDGDIVRVGDCVAVRPGDDDRGIIREKRGLSAMDEASDIWFARVVYMFEQDGDNFAHFRWFSHGGDTCLEETASPRELFLLDSCDDNPLDTIAGKIEVDFVGRSGDDNSDGLGVAELGRDCGKNKFFYRLWYNEKQGSFEDAKMHETHSEGYLNSCNKDQACVSCESIGRQQGLTEMYLERGELFYQGFRYRIDDFAYIVLESAKGTYSIGQIKEFVRMDRLKSRNNARSTKNISDSEHENNCNLEIRVRQLKRYDDLYRGHYVQLEQGETPNIRDNRRLYMTDIHVSVPADRLDGKCLVRHIEHIEDLNAFKDLEDTFYVADKLASHVSHRPEHLISEMEKLHFSELQLAETTELEFNKEQAMLEEFLSEARKLRGMDIFAGAGGLTIGLDQAGAVQTEWAIEFAPAAAIAFKANIPRVKVYNQDANLLLDRAIKQAAGARLDDLTDFQGNKTPEMPKRGEVDFMYGGPPCQGFSGINRFKKTNDIKNSLIATYLSYVDFYKPKYFLLENVEGLIHHRLGGTQVGVNKQTGGIKKGTVKFILRALTSLGYQAKFSLLQAGDFGAPQSRRRVIFWGVMPGLKMPNFPQPSHLFTAKQKATTSITLPNGVKYTTKTRRSAPLPMTTVADAVTDLPAFEYVNPHIEYPATPKQEAEEATRARRINQFKVRPMAPWIGKEKDSYVHPPLSEYQRRLRKDVPMDGVRCHFTRTWNDMLTERICSIPLVAGADHRDLPEKLRPWCLSHPDSAAERHRFWPGLFGRLDLRGAFETALTEVHPNNKQGRVIHPTQRRVISVREHARSQGFPDSYVFISDRDRVKDMHRQVGNAVPIQLAYALGLELRKAYMEDWFRERQMEKAVKGKGKTRDI